MSDCGCGCGCSGTGNCDEKLNSYNPNNNATGNFKYDGADFTCANNSSIDVKTNDGLNKVLQNLFTRVCALSAPSSYLAHTSLYKTLTAAVNVQQQLDIIEFVGANKIQASEMIRIVFSGQFSAPTATSSVIFKARVYGKDSSGGYTTPTDFATFTIPANTTATDNFEYTVCVIKVSDTSLHFSVNGKSRLGTTPVVISDANVALTGSLASHDLVFDFVGQRANAVDILSVMSISAEHIRP
tara:strand:- start:510 stop:1232 length:723 start_codon:yes stop_codon:yes gene_type:complete